MANIMELRPVPGGSGEVAEWALASFFFSSDFCSRGHHLNDHSTCFLKMDEPAGFPAGFTDFFSTHHQQIQLSIAIELIWSLPLGNKTRQYTFFIAHAYEICLIMHFWIS
jgi:hypothetical protein